MIEIYTLIVVSIPVFILWKTQLRTSQKVSLGAFLSLSIAMMIIAIVRLSGLKNNNTTWIYYWQYMEACVACIMASLLTFRTLFISGRSRVFKRQEFKGQAPSVKQRILHNMKRVNMSAWEKVQDDKRGLPEIPSATFSGLRTFIRRNHRSSGLTTAMSSELDNVDLELLAEPSSSYLTSDRGERRNNEVGNFFANTERTGISANPGLA